MTDHQSLAAPCEFLAETTCIKMCVGVEVLEKVKGFWLPRRVSLSSYLGLPSLSVNAAYCTRFTSLQDETSPFSPFASGSLKSFSDRTPH